MHHLLSVTKINLFSCFSIALKGHQQRKKTGNYPTEKHKFTTVHLIFVKLSN
ncbi:hypothetical protein C942_04063 [Photobacterium marinum]|uniref:Uncharacterized protein n=1 Tax=Photobacterium marinum TaxID=1056511 RepID=L8J2Z0_9GAMM|nr:hypothetical protein C942_04063 [Photobacterium marinum]